MVVPLVGYAVSALSGLAAGGVGAFVQVTSTTLPDLRNRAGLIAKEVGIKPDNPGSLTTDAFRHALTSAVTAEVLGQTTSKLLGDANESLNLNNNPNDARQDKFNNAFGRSLVEQGVPSEKWAEAIKKAIDKNFLITDPATDKRSYPEDFKPDPSLYKPNDLNPNDPVPNDDSDNPNLIPSLGQDVVFVIDTTDSMSDDIDEVKARSNEILDAIFDEERGLTNSRAAIVGYNDPETNTILSFTDQPSIKDRKVAATNAINSITVSGGGDIPEAVNAGLIRALDGSVGEWREEAAVRRIVLFGDAPPKDTDLRSIVLQLSKNVNIENNISTGSNQTAFIAGENDTLNTATDITGEIETSMVADSLAATSFQIETSEEDSSVTTTPIEIFTVLIGDDSETQEDFETLANATGGDFFTAVDSTKIVDTLITAIETPETPDISDLSEESTNEGQFLLGDDLSNNLLGNDKNDTLLGFRGNDTLDGSAGDDFIKGGAGDDILNGSDGNDTLTGDSGSDRLQGGAGKDVLFGDAGGDIYTYGKENTRYVISDRGDDSSDPDKLIFEDSINLAEDTIILEQREEKQDLDIYVNDFTNLVRINSQLAKVDNVIESVEVNHEVDDISETLQLNSNYISGIISESPYTLLEAVIGEDGELVANLNPITFEERNSFLSGI